MRIGVNGAFLGDAYNGISTYTEGLIRSLAQGPDECVVYSSAPRLEGQRNGISLRRTPKMLRAERGTMASLARLLWMQTVLPLRLRQDRIDLLLSPLAEGVFRTSVRQIIQVHDLIPLFYPDECPRWHPYYNTLLPRLLARTRMVLVDSAHTRTDVLREYGVAEENVSVVYPGINSHFFGADAGSAPPGFDLTAFFLFVGTYSPRKNLHTVLRAFSRIHGELPHRLVVVAYPDQFMPAVQQLASELGIVEKLRFYSGLTRSELLYLYRNATALLLLSEYEGFGYPAVEAMAVGTPCIVSDSTSVREIVEDAGIKVPSRDVEAAMTAMRKIAADGEYRKTLGGLGIRQARKFTWENTCKQVRTAVASSFCG